MQSEQSRRAVWTLLRNNPGALPRELEKLDDYLMKDIGLTKIALYCGITKPLYRE